MTDPLQVQGCRFEERFVPVEPGVELRALRWTPAAASAARPVLFVAGWVSAIEGWTDLLRALAAERPVIYLETREKNSARIEPAYPLAVERFGIDRMAQDVIAAAQALGLDGRAVAMGSSLGATVLLEALKGGRLPLGAAFLIGPNVRFRYPWWGGAVAALPAPAYHLVKRPILFYLRHFRVDAKKEPEQMKRYEATLLTANAARIKLSAQAFQGYEVWPRLETVAAPVAVASAHTDALHGKADVERLVKALPKAAAFDCPTNKYMHSAALAQDLGKFLATLE
jgi:pimeloyl-ACP methyl ester carboxylesterase